MKLTFRIEYRTAWGENLGVSIDLKDTELIMLRTKDGVNWEGSAEMLDAPAGIPITYRYGVYQDGQCFREENGTLAHRFCPGKNRNCHFMLNDNWRDLPYNAYLYSAAFSGNHTAAGIRRYCPANNCITFRALCPGLHKKNQVLGICGGGKGLNEWNAKNPVIMNELAPNVWEITIDSNALEFPLEYKFVACNSMTGEAEEWEAVENRTLTLNHLHKGEIYITPETEIQFPSMAKKIAGTAIPVFSLRSEGSFGVGDFGDLKKLVDWAVKTRQQAIQILPINDTTITGTWTDSYPYNSISIYAFHPMYLDMRQLGKLKDKEKAEFYEKKRLKLNAMSQVDYEAVNKIKRAYLKDMFVQMGRKVLASDAFKSFFKENKFWLQPYAAFSHLRDTYGTPAFNTWPAYRIYNAKEIEELCNEKSECYEAICFYYYMQFNLHVQLLEASNYARNHNVIFKGDIPIGISRNSVEAWTEPYYFNMNGQAGAPPDAFSANGQNWGFPTYNWEVMRKDNYRWWRRRFHKMAEYFTAYRIDHILGFFRIWEIPAHSVHGLLGQFAPSIPMSAEEIERFGLPFQKDFMTRPFINDDMLNRIFGNKADFVRNTFLYHSHNDIYCLRDEFNTQRKVQAWFKDKNTEEDIAIREGLYTLISNVLFVVDQKIPSMYHPRICVQNDFIFERLNDKEKEAFNRLYNHYYYERHNQFWYQEGMKKLPTLTQSTAMLACGEDLGMVPECVPWVMEQLQILSLEIERMPKDPSYEFGHVNEYPVRSVCSISTHDMSTLRGWWEEDKEQTERYYNHVMNNWGEVPETAPDWVCEDVLQRHLNSPSVLCIPSFQDWLSIDEDVRNKDVQAERINVPSNPHNLWAYRMHLTLEALLKSDALNEKIRTMIKESGRC